MFLKICWYVAAWDHELLDAAATAARKANQVGIA